jgi:hypothetical protein
MVWIRRFLITLPFAIAAVLNVLLIAADRLHLNRQHVAGYGFLFATPWGWLLDSGWFRKCSPPITDGVNRSCSHSMDSCGAVFGLPLVVVFLPSDSFVPLVAL